MGKKYCFVSTGKILRERKLKFMFGSVFAYVLVLGGLGIGGGGGGGGRGGEGRGGALKHIEDTFLFCLLHTCKGGLKLFAKTICSLEIYLIVQFTVWKNL